MSDVAYFKRAFPYQKDILALPVVDLDIASKWYSTAFGMKEIKRNSEPNPSVILSRDGVKIGFSINGRDATEDGAAILVAGIHNIKEELESNDVKVGNWQTDERDGKKFQAFFVVAPDGLCFYFHEPI